MRMMNFFFKINNELMKLGILAEVLKKFFQN